MHEKSELWIVQDIRRKKVNVFEMEGVTRRYRIKNEVPYRRVGVKKKIACIVDMSIL